MITDNWSIFANYTYLDSEILQNISNVAIGGGTIDFLAGDPLPTTPEHSFSLWTTYEVTPWFSDRLWRHVSGRVHVQSR